MPKTVGEKSVCIAWVPDPKAHASKRRKVPPPAAEGVEPLFDIEGTGEDAGYKVGF